MTRRLTNSLLAFLAVPALGIFALFAAVTMALWCHTPTGLRWRAPAW